jgi:hypothetical protein
VGTPLRNTERIPRSLAGGTYVPHWNLGQVVDRSGTDAVDRGLFFQHYSNPKTILNISRQRQPLEVASASASASAETATMEVASAETATMEVASAETATMEVASAPATGSATGIRCDLPEQPDPMTYWRSVQYLPPSDALWKPRPESYSVSFREDVRERCLDCGEALPPAVPLIDGEVLCDNCQAPMAL